MLAASVIALLAAAVPMAPAAVANYDPSGAPHGGFTATAPTAPYLLAFATCVGGNCDDPVNHMIHLAQSADGVSWSEVPGWQSYIGSVPDVFRRGNTIYVIGHGVTKLDAVTGKATGHTLAVKKANGQDAMARDTAFAGQTADGRLVVVYVPSMQDVAGASEIPVMVAIEDQGSDGTAFTTTGAAITISKASLGGQGEPTDPDVFFNGSSWVLYTSVGANLDSYLGSAVTGPFDLASATRVSSGAGGVPSALATPGGVWTYVNDGSTQSSVVIKRAVSATGTAPIPSSSFATVLTGAAVGGLTAESPGIAANIPGTECGAGCAATSSAGSSSTPTAGAPAARPGARCAKAGQKGSFQGRPLTCRKVKGKLAWSR